MEGEITHKQILDSSNNGVIATDAAGRVSYINSQASRILALEERKIIGAYIADFLPKIGSLVSKSMETRKPQLGQHISDEKMDLVVNVTIINRDEVVVGVVCSFVEMDEFETIAQKLESYEELNRRLHAIIDSSSDGIWVCDGEGRIITINKASEKISGMKAKDVVGENIESLVEEGLFDRSVTLEVLRTKKQVNMMQYVTKTQKNLLVTGTPIFDHKGNVSLVMVNERDITDLNRLREQLEQNRMVTEKVKDTLAELSMLEIKGQEIVAESEEMKQVLTVALKLARMEVSDILLLGASGSGKGLISRFIHNNSKRNKNPFIQINCAALPESLLEAELFGYEKGAFTGAREQGKAGLFELAHTGTLFLDEIGDLPLSLQSKLLTYLDNHEVRRLGGTKSKVIDCTIIAATNQDLEKLEKQKKFRQDLFYRLNIFTVHIPPLRERPEDVFELASYFLQIFNRAYGLNKRLSPRSVQLLQAYQFPGNVRELKNIIKKAVVLSETDVLDDFISGSLINDGMEKASAGEAKGRVRSLTAEIRAAEKKILKNARLRCKSTREMASYLKISQPSVVRKLKKHGLS